MFLVCKSRFKWFIYIFIGEVIDEIQVSKYDGVWFINGSAMEHFHAIILLSKLSNVQN